MTENFDHYRRRGYVDSHRATEDGYRGSCVPTRS